MGQTILLFAMAYVVFEAGREYFGTPEAGVLGVIAVYAAIIIVTFLKRRLEGALEHFCSRIFYDPKKHES